MTTFDDLQRLWHQQSGSGTNPAPMDLMAKAEANMKRLKTTQFITIAILSALTTVLAGYFAWVGAHRLNALTMGLGTMIGVILVRIILEWISVTKLKRISPGSAMIEFSHQMQGFYTWRRRIHILFVPTIYASYTLGFILLLPSFHEYLSRGMYLYVVLSGFGSLVVLAFFIARQIRRETRILNLLKSI